jgi:hypothetical protein
VNEPFESGPVRLNYYPLGRFNVNGIKSLLSMLDVEADRIYSAVGVGKGIHD